MPYLVATTKGSLDQLGLDGSVVAREVRDLLELPGRFSGRSASSKSLGGGEMDELVAVARNLGRTHRIGAKPGPSDEVEHAFASVSSSWLR